MKKPHWRSFCKVADQIIPTKKENLTLLGAPVLPSAVDETLQSKLTSLCRMLDRLEQLDAHEALFLLRNCFAIPMLTYVLRAAASFTSPVLEQYDLEIQNTLKKILNVQLTTRLWECPNGLKFVQEVGRRISVESGEPRSTEFLMQAIGMAVQRGNAATVLGTVCKGQHLEELYYV